MSTGSIPLAHLLVLASVVRTRVLEDVGCDQQSIQALFLLAQEGAGGLGEAHALLRKIVVEKSAANRIRDPSKFLQKCSVETHQSIVDSRLWEHKSSSGGRGRW